MPDDPPHTKKATERHASRRPSNEAGSASESNARPATPREADRPTLNPPFDIEAFARANATDSAAPAAPDGSSTSERITLTNEVELELARARSAQSSQPPRTRSSGALSIADAHAPSTVPPAARSKEAPARTASSSNIEAAVLSAVSGAPGPEISERTIDDPAVEMRERFSLGDYSGALEMAEIMLAEDPSNLEAAECGENCRAILERMFAAKIGALDRVPAVIVPNAQMRWLSLDHRAGFILSLIDGSSTVEMILDVSGMPRLDALRILHELVQQRIVAFRGP